MARSARPKPQVRKTWQQIAKDAQAHRDSTISQLDPPLPYLSERPVNVLQVPKKVLTERECWITEMGVEGLMSRLQKGPPSVNSEGLSSVEVTNAFLRRAGLAQKLTNCVTELLPSRALARANNLDAYFVHHRKPIGRLHGLPISTKEMIGMAGLTLTSGYITFCDQIAEEDAHVLQILWNAGAVFYARTTEPQTMMHLETDSNMYGVTVCPWNTNLSAGGSSGGEGALIALRGSCLGLGSDIGGSIRNPACHNGIYGFKPTSLRIPTDGWSSISAAADSVSAVIGPMSTSIHGLKLLMQTILDAQPWLIEPALIPMPWRNIAINPTLENPLVLGIMMNDGVVTPHPPITRALEILSAKLSSLAHRNVHLIPFEPHLHSESWAILSSLFYTDAGVEDLTLINQSNEPIRPLTHWIIKENPCVKRLTVKDYGYWMEEREAYRKEYANHWNNVKFDGRWPVDAVICPVCPHVAPQHNTSKYWSYTAQWNLLDYPAVSFPVTHVDPKLDKKGGTPFDELTEVDGECWELYDPKVFAGLPVSLQLVGRRFEDEKVLAVLEYLTNELRILPTSDELLNHL